MLMAVVAWRGVRGGKGFCGSRTGVVVVLVLVVCVASLRPGAAGGLSCVYVYFVVRMHVFVCLCSYVTVRWGAGRRVASVGVLSSSRQRFEERWVRIALLFMVLAGFADVGRVIGLRCW